MMARTSRSARPEGEVADATAHIEEALGAQVQVHEERQHAGVALLVRLAHGHVGVELELVLLPVLAGVGVWLGALGGSAVPIRGPADQNSVPHEGQRSNVATRPSGTARVRVVARPGTVQAGHCTAGAAEHGGHDRRSATVVTRSR